jgi:hypothetical protein
MAALKATCSINLRKRIQAQRQADAAAQHCLTTPHSNSVKLVLESARKSRGTNHWDKDDYDVRLGDGSGPVVGRIFRHPQGQPRFCTITAREQPPSVDNHGYAVSRERTGNAIF